MVLLALLISFTLLVVHVKLAPRRYLVHAARACDFPEGRSVSQKIPRPQLLRDVKNSSFFSRKGRFYGEALGGSMEGHGISDGAEFFADYVPAELCLNERIKLLREGDIVVVDDVAEYSETGKRLRKIKRISADGQVEFEADNRGKDHTIRSALKVIAIVTHVCD